MTMSDDRVMFGTDEDIPALCKECNGVYDVSSRENWDRAKKTGEKLDNLVDILKTLIKKQENFVTIDLNSSIFVLDPNASFQQALTSSDSQVPVVTVWLVLPVLLLTIVKELEETSKKYDKLEEADTNSMWTCVAREEGKWEHIPWGSLSFSVSYQYLNCI